MPVIVGFLRRTAPKALVFSPESSAKIVSLFGAASSVEHWLVTGSGGPSGGGVGIVRLEDLAQRVEADTELELAMSGDTEGLLVVSRPAGGSSADTSLLTFSQSALLRSAECLAEWLRSQGAQEFSWSGLPRMSLEGLLLQFVVPLFNGVAGLINMDFDPRKFWEQVRADGITYAALSQEQLRAILRRGRSQRWIKPEQLQIVLLARQAISSGMIADFEKLFEMPVLTCYSIEELGGLITAVPAGQDASYRARWVLDLEVCSVGPAVTGSQVDIFDPLGKEVGEEVIGEVWAKGVGTATSRISAKGEEPLLMTPKGYRTGDDGFYLRDKQGRKLFFIMGHRDNLILRKDDWIYPDPITNLLLDYKGVEYAQVVGFNNIAVGQEIGAYVVVSGKVGISEETLLGYLAERLDLQECPKVVVFGQRPEEGEHWPTLEEIKKMFSKYAEVDYSAALLA